MIKDLHDIRFPYEPEMVRKKRNEILKVEIQLIRQIEQVAEMRLELLPGGKDTDW